MQSTTQPDALAAAQEAAARAADATADAYRALAQITRQIAHPQGEPMPWDAEGPEAAAPAPPEPQPAAAAAPAAESALPADPAPAPAADPAPAAPAADPAPAAPAAPAEPDPLTPLTPEQQQLARSWVQAMSATQRKAFAAAFRHAFNVDPSQKSVAPLITQLQHYSFTDRFTIEANGGIAE